MKPLIPILTLLVAGCSSGNGAQSASNAPAKQPVPDFIQNDSKSTNAQKQGMADHLPSDMRPTGGG